MEGVYKKGKLWWRRIQKSALEDESNLSFSLLMKRVKIIYYYFGTQGQKYNVSTSKTMNYF